MSSRNIKIKSPRALSWEIEGSDYIRNVAFKALKEGEKLGIGLGGKGQRTEVVVVREGTQSYWKGIKKGYKILTVNSNDVNAITVKSSIQGCATSGKNFTIGFQVPGKPDWADSNKTGQSIFKDDADLPVDDQPKEQKESAVEEAAVKEDSVELKFALAEDTATAEQKEENADDGYLMGDSADVEDYISLQKKLEDLKEVEEVSQDVLEKATKAELEEMKRLKQEEYDKLKTHEAALRELIKKKEKEFKEAVTRKNLEELKGMRRTAKEVARRIKRALDELERIRKMLEMRIAELAAGLKDLAAASADRDARLREMEEAIRIMEEKALDM